MKAHFAMVARLVAAFFQTLASAARSQNTPNCLLFASPSVPGVSLRDTGIVYAVYRNRMIETQRRHLANFQVAAAGKLQAPNAARPSS
jgi:hypothetical protein